MNIEAIGAVLVSAGTLLFTIWKFRRVDARGAKKSDLEYLQTQLTAQVAYAEVLKVRCDDCDHRTKLLDEALRLCRDESARDLAVALKQQHDLLAENWELRGRVAGKKSR